MSDSIELKQAVRSLRRAPLFLIATTLTLALGIGAATSVFNVVDAVLLRPMPYPHADRLVTPYHTLLGLGIPLAAQSRGTYFHYRRTVHAFQSLAAYRIVSVNLADASGTADAERAHAATISANLLSTLGVAPLRGRAFTADEDLPNGTHVALISDGLWHRRFGGDEHILERTVRVDGTLYRIVGVMPPEFHFPEPETAVWLPIQLDPAAPDAEGFNLAAVARLAPGATLETARRELDTQLQRLPEAYPNVYPGLPTRNVLAQSEARAFVRTLRDNIVGDFAGVLRVVGGTAILLLVVTCANVVNLLLVRSEGRAREIAVRSALGATRARLLAYFAAEGSVLAAIGAVLGLALAIAMTRLLVHAGPTNFPRWQEVGVGSASVAFALLVSVLIAVTCTVLPALQFRGVRVGTMLREGGRGTAGRERHRTQRTLIVVQVALALLVLAGSGLLARTVWRLSQVRPGFDPSHTLAFTISLPKAQYPQLSGVSQFYNDVLDRLRALPGVEDVGVTSKLPLVGGETLVPVYVEAFPVTGHTLPAVFPFPIASAGYFRAMQIPLLSGRLFPEDLPPSAPAEVVVSRDFVEHYWHDPTGRRALGQRIKVSDSENAPWSTIVGVVESVRDSSLGGAPVAEVYTPLRVHAVGVPDSLPPFEPRLGTIVIRSAGDPLGLASAARRAIREADPSVPVYDVQSMTEVLAHATARTRFALLALAVAAAITLVLGGIGLYGVIAYVVSLRTRELGLRIALGAEPRTVLTLVLRDGLGLAVIGVVAGLAAFLALGRFLRGMLVGVTATDPVTLVGVTLAVLVVCAIASWVPAWRASHIDPPESLRAE
jgi:putative ABC transport system permease protein